jgi:hypothetical protein
MGKIVDLKNSSNQLMGASLAPIGIHKISVLAGSSPSSQHTLSKIYSKIVADLAMSALALVSSKTDWRAMMLRSL